MDEKSTVRQQVDEARYPESVPQLIAELLNIPRTSKPPLAPEYKRPPFVHRVPRCKIRIDGEREPSNAVQRFDGKQLYYVIDDRTQDESELLIFTSSENLREHTGAKLILPDDAESTADYSSRESELRAQKVTLAGYVDLFEHPSYEGANWRFYRDWGAISDFRKVYPTLWWSTNINDKISSIDVEVRADPPGTIPWVILYSDIDFAGEELWTSSSYSYDDGGGGMRKNLIPIGWNDIASSLRYGYTL